MFGIIKLSKRALFQKLETKANNKVTHELFMILCIAVSHQGEFKDTKDDPISFSLLEIHVQ